MYHEKNAKKLLEQKKVYYKKNRDKCILVSKRYQASTVGKATVKRYSSSLKGRIADRNAQHKRRIQKQCGTGITNEQWNSILRDYNFRCAYCGVQGNMTIDHVMPLSKGGEHSAENIVPACAGCNSKKCASTNWIPKKFKKAIGD